MSTTNPTPGEDRPRTPEDADADQTRGEHAAPGQGSTAMGHSAAHDRAEHEHSERGHTTREYTARADTIPDHTTRDTFIGTDERVHGAANVSWGAIFAGVVTFIALMFVFGLISIGLGFQGVAGMAVGIWSAVALLVALAIAGFVAGTLAVRAGFLHGIGTWATSIVAMLLLIGWIGSSALGAVGGVVGNVAQGVLQGDAITTEDLGNAEIDQQELNQTQQELEDTTQQAQDELAASAWWAVGGLLVGAVVAGLTGVAGSRSVHTDHERDRTVVL